jgi:hypothetical protein
VKRLLILGLIVTYGFLSECKAQSRPPTRIVRCEVDGRTVKTSYRIFFLRRGTWLEAHKTGEAFAIPREVENEEYLTLRIEFGKYKLNFPRIHFSNFKNDWIVGVDNKPFSEELVKPEEQRLIDQISYIQFQGEPDRQLVIRRWKK